MEKQMQLSHRLKKVKLIIGNGFDLYCGLKTTYKDFFHSGDKFDYLNKWIICSASFLHQKRSQPESEGDVLPPLKNLEIFTCWDVYFVMVANGSKGELWSDIEAEMLESLTKTDDETSDDYRPHWESVWDVLREKRSKRHKPGSVILADFLEKKAQRDFLNKNDYYDFLLGELRQFEMTFAYFILGQHVVTNDFIPRTNGTYIRNAEALLGLLCNPEEIVSIDCFNYCFMPIPKYFEKCRFVNGDCTNAIFGLDSVFKISDPRNIFTKTSRRLEWKMSADLVETLSDFNNAIVFGHPLNAQDRSYFFPILDQLELTNPQSPKKLIIAYSVYDEIRREELKKKLRENAQLLLASYAEYLGKEKEAPRFVDQMVTRGRIDFLEIDVNQSASCNDFFNATNKLPDKPSREDILQRLNIYRQSGKFWN